jgi:hypothetical protein
MHFPILKFALIVAASAFGAALAMFRYAFDTGEPLSDDGPRALIAEFFGLWIGLSLFIWSFTVAGKAVEWTLRSVAAFCLIAGYGLSAYFGNTTEVPETSDKEPTGFKNKTTELHLE